MANKLYWAPILEELEKLLPPRTYLRQIDLFDGIWSKGGNKDLGDRYMTTTFLAPSPPNGEIPQEIRQFQEALQNSAVIKKWFPQVLIREIGQQEAKGGRIASVSISCSSKTSAKKP
jgi:hypothetical protein